jgi:hypothetical protein
LLTEVKAPDSLKVVVAKAEAAADAAIMASGGGNVSLAWAGYRIFDYTTHNGVTSVGAGDAQFILRFAQGGSGSIRLYRGENLTDIARVQGAITGQPLNFADYEHSSDVYNLNVADCTAARF